MATPFIPAQDAQALAWMQTFAAGVSASPATYMISAAERAVSTERQLIGVVSDMTALRSPFG